MNLLNILLQATASKNGAMQQILLIVIILVIFYFFMIRPQMKRSKEQKKFRDNLQKGQKVITIGGIHGKIVEIQDTTVTIEVENGARLCMEKSSIASSIGDQLPDNK
ncbi:MAG: preprotein translocase subunit YajC [Bacteroides sp.]|nr:preprotein translocase subunit YajC [Bacteroides sp.]